ncbi:RagB/SusD family nutrient uptake outer membrane protein [Flavihumibacter sp. UBA7668]|uniref:RagB/SusD family nutrient uptake outer membrane protein n=1 Tax=Flavihumibacter sp. UBA7668 TaxID=1946542 RepID=UPI0025BF015E|nr:RagB/SusD family nutrient uptake outer membrane protein [Flavihumibacter sp. UBA7668]
MNYRIIFAGTVLFLASCTRQLDEKPKSIAVETFYNTKEEVDAGLNAIYPPLRSGGMLGGLYTVQVETYADYMYGRGSHAMLSDYAGLDNTNRSRTDGSWRELYTAIRNANIILDRAPGATSMSEQDKAFAIGEARFLRALSYFHLVKNWAGVPIRTVENMDAIDVKRSTQEEVYAQILEDLLAAETGLPDQSRLAGAPNKMAAKAVLADVYMHLNRWPEVKQKAGEIIASGKYSLVPISTATDYEKIYGADVVTSTEEVFYLKFSRQGNTQGFGYIMYAHYPNSGYFPPGGYYTNYSDAEANPLMKNWDRNDLRYQYNWYNQTFGLGPNTILNKKFFDRQATNANNGGNDYPMYKYSDIIYMYAEADGRINNGGTAESLEWVNKIHRRSYGLPMDQPAANDFILADYGSTNAFVDLVVQERMYEQMYEGKRWHELKRLGIVNEAVLANKGKTVAEKHLLWPIPVSETNYNKAIDPVADQNPGY